jgi:CRISP-associated protein Cas1
MEYTYSMAKFYKYKNSVFINKHNNSVPVLSYNNGSVEITSNKNSKEIYKQSILVSNLSFIIIHGSALFSSSVLLQSKKDNFGIITLTYAGKAEIISNPEKETNFVYQLAQLKCQETFNFRVARLILEKKFQSQCIAPEKIDYFIIELAKLEDRTQLLSLEASAQKIHFQTIFSELNWIRREPMKKNDEINTLLDFGYTLLFNIMDCIVKMHGLNPYLGIIHTPFYNRHSFTCDCMEPFRKFIDNTVQVILKNKSLTYVDYDEISQKYKLIKGKISEVGLLFIESLHPHLDDMNNFVKDIKQEIYQDQLTNQ